MRPTLRCAWQFDEVYARGRKYTTPVLVLFHLERAPDTRVAFVASRKVGGAVQRNRAKRVLRAALAQATTTAAEPLRGWLVLVARRGLLALSSAEAAAELRLLLTGRAGARPTVREKRLPDRTTG